MSVSVELNHRIIFIAKMLHDEHMTPDFIRATWICSYDCLLNCIELDKRNPEEGSQPLK